MTGTSAHVVVTKDGQVYAEGDTDETGLFQASLVAGDYVITISKAGYDDIVKEVTVAETEELVVNFTSPQVPNCNAQNSIGENVVVYLWPPYGGMLDHGSVTGAGFSQTFVETVITTLTPTCSETISESVVVHK